MAEAITFGIFAIVAIAGAVTMLGAKNPVYSAVGLLSTMFSLAIMYILLDAHFVAVVQVIIYAGAVMTLFLFVIMLIGVDRPEAYGPRPASQRVMTYVVAGVLFVAIVLAGSQAWVTGSDAFGTIDLNGTIENVADGDMEDDMATMAGTMVPKVDEDMSWWEQLKAAPGNVIDRI